jgi:hypothetical protein
MKKNKPRIILISPVIFRNSVLNAIELTSCNSVDYSYKTLPENILFRRFVGKFSLLFGLFSYLSFNKQLAEILKPGVLQNDDLILVIHGHIPNRQNKRLLENLKTRYIVLWTTDSISRHKHQSGLMNYASRLYLHDGGEVMSKNESWMPFGFDDQVFTKNNFKKDIDILFIGNIYSKRYFNRMSYLLTLEKSGISKNFKCVYAGQVSGIINIIKLLLGTKKIRRTGKLDLNVLSEYINRSRICINILQDDGAMPVNPMFFAIPACGSVMVTEKHDFMNNLLMSDKNIILVNKINFTEKIYSSLNSSHQINNLNPVPTVNNSFRLCIDRIVNDFLMIS